MNELRGAQNEDRVIDANVKNSVSKAMDRLFSNGLFLPIHPFKVLLHDLLYDEACQAFSGEPALDYLSIPEQKQLPQNAKFMIQLVAFGSDAHAPAASKHLAKLLNGTSVQGAKSMAHFIGSALGHHSHRLSPGTLPGADSETGDDKIYAAPIRKHDDNHIKTDSLQADFLEVVLADSCLNNGIAQPRFHRLSMLVEIIVSGKTFDECMTIFIRRVLEDAHNANKSEKIMASSLKAITRTTSGAHSEQVINIECMKSKRHQILTILKATIMNEGDISLEFYIRMKRVLPYYHAASALYREESEGYTHVFRRYKFSFRDANNHTRCFTHMPFESLALGLFMSLNDAKMYLEAYTDHAARLRKSKAAAAAAAAAGSASEIPAPPLVDPLLVEVVGHRSGAVVSAIDSGRLVDAASGMIELQCLFAWKSKSMNYCMAQLSHLTNSTVGHICIVKDAVRSAKQVVQLLVERITHSTAVASCLRSLVNPSPEERDEVHKLQALYRSIAPSVMEVRHLVLDFIRVEQEHGSTPEIRYMAPYLQQLLWSMFDVGGSMMPLAASDLVPAPPQKRKVHRDGESLALAAPMGSGAKEDSAERVQSEGRAADPEKDPETKNDVGSASKALFAALDPLYRTEEGLYNLASALHMLEASVGADVLAGMMKRDLESYRVSQRSAGNMGLDLGIGMSAGSGSTGSDIFAMLRTFGPDSPRCILDTLGFVRDARRWGRYGLEGLDDDNHGATGHGADSGGYHLTPSANQVPLALRESESKRWRPLNVSRTLRQQLLREESPHPSSSSVSSQQASPAVALGLQQQTERISGMKAGGVGILAAGKRSRTGTASTAASAGASGRHRELRRFSAEWLLTTHGYPLPQSQRHRRLVMHLWETYSLLSEYPLQRLDGIDITAAVLQERARRDVPEFLTHEGALMRYLCETQVVRALQEAYFYHEASFNHARVPSNNSQVSLVQLSGDAVIDVANYETHQCFQRVAMHLFKFPCFLQLWNGVSNQLLARMVFAPARWNRIRMLTPPRSRRGPASFVSRANSVTISQNPNHFHVGGASIINLRSLCRSYNVEHLLDVVDDVLRLLRRYQKRTNASRGTTDAAAGLRQSAGSFEWRRRKIKVPRRVRHMIAGGVIGSDRVLTALPHPEQVFAMMWNLPPLFPSAPTFSAMAAAASASVSAVGGRLNKAADQVGGVSSIGAIGGYIASVGRVHLKTFCGLSLRTAALWSMPHLESVRRKEELRSALEAKHRLFLHRQASQQPAVLLLPHPSENESQSQRGRKMYPARSEGSEEEHDREQAALAAELRTLCEEALHEEATVSVDTDLGVRTGATDEVELEVVVKITHEQARDTAMQAVCGAFAREVSRCCAFMQEDDDWAFLRVAVCGKQQSAESSFANSTSTGDERTNRRGLGQGGEGGGEARNAICKVFNAADFGGGGGAEGSDMEPSRTGARQADGAGFRAGLAVDGSPAGASVGVGTAQSSAARAKKAMEALITQLALLGVRNRRGNTFEEVDGASAEKGVLVDRGVDVVIEAGMRVADPGSRRMELPELVSLFHDGVVKSPHDLEKNDQHKEQRQHPQQQPPKKPFRGGALSSGPFRHFYTKNDSANENLHSSKEAGRDAASDSSSGDSQESEGDARVLGYVSPRPRTERQRELDDVFDGDVFDQRAGITQLESDDYSEEGEEDEEEEGEGEDVLGGEGKRRHSVDPTLKDVDRICADSHLSKLRALAKAKARLGDSGASRGEGAVGGAVGMLVECYVPCKVHFTLLAEYVPSRFVLPWSSGVVSNGVGGAGLLSKHGNAGREGNVKVHRGAGTRIRGAFGRQKSNQNSDSSLDVVHTAAGTDHLLGPQRHSLSIGSAASIARLVASTLWVSVESAKEIWKLAKDGHGEAACVVIEARRHLAEYHAAQRLTRRFLRSDHTHDYQRSYVPSKRDSSSGVFPALEEDFIVTDGDNLSQQQHVYSLMGGVDSDRKPETPSPEEYTKANRREYALDQFADNTGSGAASNEAIVSSFGSALCCALLSQNYALAVSVYRAHNSLVFKLQALMRAVRLCLDMLVNTFASPQPFLASSAAVAASAAYAAVMDASFGSVSAAGSGVGSSCGSSSSSIGGTAAARVGSVRGDVVSLGQTIVRHVCFAYRVLMMSPQAVHLRGGCAQILLLLNRLERVLGLGAISLRWLAPSDLSEEYGMGQHIGEGGAVSGDGNQLPDFLPGPAVIPPRVAAGAVLGRIANGVRTRVSGGFGGIFRKKTRSEMDQNPGDAHSVMPLTSSGMRSDNITPRLLEDFISTNDELELAASSATHSTRGGGAFLAPSVAEHSEFGPHEDETALQSSRSAVASEGRLAGLGTTAGGDAVGASTFGGAAEGGREDGESIFHGEVSFRRALGRAKSVREGVHVLRRLLGLSHALLHALGRDCQLNFLDVEEAMDLACSRIPLSSRSYPTPNTTATPSAATRCNNSINGSDGDGAARVKCVDRVEVVNGRLQAEGGGRVISEVSFETLMLPSVDVLDLVLGEDVSFQALESYIRRAETKTNQLLESTHLTRVLSGAGTAESDGIHTDGKIAGRTAAGTGPGPGEGWGGVNDSSSEKEVLFRGGHKSKAATKSFKYLIKSITAIGKMNSLQSREVARSTPQKPFAVNAADRGSVTAAARETNDDDNNTTNDDDNNTTNDDDKNNKNNNNNNNNGNNDDKKRKGNAATGAELARREEILIQTLTEQSRAELLLNNARRLQQAQPADSPHHDAETLRKPQPRPIFSSYPHNSSSTAAAADGNTKNSSLPSPLKVSVAATSFNDDAVIFSSKQRVHIPSMRENSAYVALQREIHGVSARQVSSHMRAFEASVRQRRAAAAKPFAAPASMASSDVAAASDDTSVAGYRSPITVQGNAPPIHGAYAAHASDDGRSSSSSRSSMQGVGSGSLFGSIRGFASRKYGTVVSSENKITSSDKQSKQAKPPKQQKFFKSFRGSLKFSRKAPSSVSASTSNFDSGKADARARTVARANASSARKAAVISTAAAVRKEMLAVRFARQLVTLDSFDEHDEDESEKSIDSVRVVSAVSAGSAGEADSRDTGQLVSDLPVREGSTSERALDLLRADGAEGLEVLTEEEEDRAGFKREDLMKTARQTGSRRIAFDFSAGSDDSDLASVNGSGGSAAGVRKGEEGDLERGGREHEGMATLLERDRTDEFRSHYHLSTFYNEMQRSAGASSEDNTTADIAAQGVSSSASLSGPTGGEWERGYGHQEGGSLQRSEPASRIGDLSFSATGFKIVGASVRQAAESNSMLRLLRAYNNLEGPEEWRNPSGIGQSSHQHHGFVAPGLHVPHVGGLDRRYIPVSGVGSDTDETRGGYGYGISSERVAGGGGRGSGRRGWRDERVSKLAAGGLLSFQQSSSSAKSAFRSPPTETPTPTLTQTKMQRGVDAGFREEGIDLSANSRRDSVYEHFSAVQDQFRARFQNEELQRQERQQEEQHLSRDDRQAHFFR